MELLCGSVGRLDEQHLTFSKAEGAGAGGRTGGDIGQATGGFNETSPVTLDSPWDPPLGKHSLASELVRMGSDSWLCWFLAVWLKAGHFAP